MSKKNNKVGAKKSVITSAPTVDKKETAQVAPAITAAEPTKKDPKKDTKPVAPATRVNVVQVGDLAEMATGYNSRQQGGLDANHQIDLLTGLKGMIHDDPDAGKKYGIPETAIDTINKVVTNGFMVAMINEIQFGKSAFAMRMKVSQLEAIKEFAPMIGVTIDDKALPAPAEDGTVELESKSVIISDETKAAAKAEKEIVDKQPTVNPSEIENNDQLKDSLNFILSDNETTPQFYDRIEKAVSFYKSYLQIIAKKANDDAKYTEIENKSRVNLLMEISKICHNIPFSTAGLAKYMLESTKNQKSPLKAFLSFKKATMSSDIKVKPGDQLISDIVKVLIIWAADSDIERVNVNIKKSNDNLAILNKDTKKNAKAIELEKKKIEVYNSDIEVLNNVSNIIANPTSDIVTEIEEILGGKKPADRTATFLIKNISEIYYPNADENDPKNVEALNNNIVQMAGVIINMFRDPNANNIAYSIGNLKEIKTTEDSKESEGAVDAAKK